MNSINLQEEVRRAISTSWSSFAQSHPRLARVIDREVLIETVTKQLAADPDYQRALDNAAHLEYGAQAVTGMIRRFVTEALQSLGW